MSLITPTSKGCDINENKQGIYCKTCMLLKRVDSYMLDLFRDAAEGRLAGFD
jgi:late competence protein required for DNA uptake (superfamily II DNA/RNA helicase)